MENNKNALLQSGLYHGLLLGIISIVLSLTIWVLDLIEAAGLWGTALIGIISFIITFVFVLFVTKAFRNQQMDGSITFKNAFAFGIIVIFISTIISVVYTYIFHSYIDPGYSQHIMDVMESETYNLMVKTGASEVQIDETLEKFKDVPTAIESSIQSLKYGLLMGAIIALITSLIAKRKNELK